MIHCYEVDNAGQGVVEGKCRACGKGKQKFIGIQEACGSARSILMDINVYANSDDCPGCKLKEHKLYRVIQTYCPCYYTKGI